MKIKLITGFFMLFLLSSLAFAKKYPHLTITVRNHYTVLAPAYINASVHTPFHPDGKVIIRNLTYGLNKDYKMDSMDTLDSINLSASFGITTAIVQCYNVDDLYYDDGHLILTMAQKSIWRIDGMCTAKYISPKGVVSHPRFSCDTK